jgi:hypothetical protein
MFELCRSLSFRELGFEQLPTLVASLAIAEVFYKFHSFLLESIAFLVTWYAIGAVVFGVKKLLAGPTTKELVDG